MNWLDPDQPDPRYIQSLVDILDAPMQKISDAILHPKGGSPASIEWNLNRRIQASAIVGQTIQQAKQNLGTWTGKAIGASASEGTAAAARQLDALQKTGAFPGISPTSPIRPGFNSPNLDVVRVLAQDTYRDGALGLDHTGQQVQQLLRKMSDNGLTAEQVNKMMAKSVIEGTPMELQIELRTALEKIHGKTITFPSGKTMTCADYAKTLARTRLREAHVVARHARLRKDGVFYVVIIGNVTRYPCTAYLGKIYFIGDGEDPSDHHYPNLDTLHTARGDQAPPFHPNCSKSTAPIILKATPAEELKIGEPDEISQKMAEVGANSTAGQRLADTVNVEAHAQKRIDAVAEIGRQRARAHGYNPPPWSPGSADVAHLRKKPTGDFITDAAAEKILKPLGVSSVQLHGKEKIGDVLIPRVAEVMKSTGANFSTVEVDAGIFKSAKVNGPLNYDPQTRKLRINPNWEHWERIPERTQEKYQAGAWSTDRADHILWHEAAHDLVLQQGMAAYRELKKRHFSKALADEIALSVSKTAAVNALEFVSEVYSMKQAGTFMTLSARIKSLYTEVGGI